MVKTTREQRVALKVIWQRRIWDLPNPLSYREFRRTVTPGLGYIMVPWAGMWLGIEPDGYTHS
jgi:hypothetical protein